MAYPISVLFLDLKIKCGSQQIRKILIIISTQFFMFTETILLFSNMLIN